MLGNNRLLRNVMGNAGELKIWESPAWEGLCHLQEQGLLLPDAL